MVIMCMTVCVVSAVMGWLTRGLWDSFWNDFNAINHIEAPCPVESVRATWIDDSDWQAVERVMVPGL